MRVIFFVPFETAISLRNRVFLSQAHFFRCLQTFFMVVWDFNIRKEFPLKLGEFLDREERLDRNFEKKKFAEKIGISARTLYNYAYGGIEPSLKAALSIWKETKCQVTLEEMVKDEKEKNFPS